MRRLWWVLLLLLAAVPAQAAAPADPDGLRSGPEATVAGVIDGDTVILESAVMGATQVRLVGIQAPKPPLGRRNFPTWPLAGPSKRALEGLTLGRTVRLSFGGAEKDRHGRLLAHLYRADGAWVQGEMLKMGMARVYSFSDNRAMVPEMLALEEEARLAKRGIWGLRFYAVRTPESLSSWTGTFQLVRGRVKKAARIKSRVYLNFGDDWRTDFTITLQAKARRLFRKAGLEPLSLEGREVRVRGWLKKFNGPMIEATHPEQIEVLTQEAPGEATRPGVSPENKNSGAEGSATGKQQEARSGAEGSATGKQQEAGSGAEGSATGKQQEARSGAEGSATGKQQEAGSGAKGSATGKQNE